MYENATIKTKKSSDLKGPWIGYDDVIIQTDTAAPTMCEFDPSAS